jgi:pentose-5-phosphate-3-epimerase
MPEHLTLKWGTLKAWTCETPKSIEALRKYRELGMSMSVALQRDTPEQKQLLCDLIDVMQIDSVCLDWTGKDVTKEEAKQYVMDYGKE